jgi:hypothetical protein
MSGPSWKSVGKGLGWAAPSVVKDSTTPVQADRVAFSLSVRDMLHMVGLTLRPWFGEIMHELVQGTST